MKISYIREFIQLADSLNFSSTADSLFISQSTLSRHIKTMENELGFPLFITSSHGVSLTPAGKDALKSFHVMLRDYDALLSRNRQANSDLQGKLRFGMMYYLLDDGYIDFVEGFQRKYPGIEVVCKTNYQPNGLYEDLLCGKIDVATLSYNPGLSTNIRFQKTASMHYAVLVKDSNPLAKQSSVRLADLQDLPLIRLKRDLYSENHVSHMLSIHAFTPQKETYTDNIETVPAKIRSTDGYHITGDKCRKQRARGIAYLKLDEPKSIIQMGVMAMDRENTLIDLFFREIRAYFD